MGRKERPRMRQVVGYPGSGVELVCELLKRCGERPIYRVQLPAGDGFPHVVRDPRAIAVDQTRRVLLDEVEGEPDVELVKVRVLSVAGDMRGGQWDGLGPWSDYVIEADRRADLTLTLEVLRAGLDGDIPTAALGACLKIAPGVFNKALASLRATIRSSHARAWKSWGWEKDPDGWRRFLTDYQWATFAAWFKPGMEAIGA